MNLHALFLVLTTFLAATVEIIVQSNLLAGLSSHFFKGARQTDTLLLLIIFGMGIVSVFLMNDTVAIIGTPVILMLAKKNAIAPKPLMALAAEGTIAGNLFILGGINQDFFPSSRVGRNDSLYNVTREILLQKTAF